MKSTTGQHDLAHPVNWIAAELRVDRTSLARLLGSGEFTIRQAFEALIQKHENKKDLQRRQKAEADTAEIDAAERRETLMLTENHLRIVKELGTRSRSKIMGCDIPEECKKKALAALASIKIDK